MMEYDIHTFLDLLTLLATSLVIYMLWFPLRDSYQAAEDNIQSYFVVSTSRARIVHVSTMPFLMCSCIALLAQLKYYAIACICLLQLPNQQLFLQPSGPSLLVQQQFACTSQAKLHMLCLNLSPTLQAIPCLLLAFIAKPGTQHKLIFRVRPVLKSCAMMVS